MNEYYLYLKLNIIPTCFTIIADFFLLVKFVLKLEYVYDNKMFTGKSAFLFNFYEIKNLRCCFYLQKIHLYRNVF